MAYTVELTERAEADVERVFLWMGRISPELAERWHVGLVTKFASLATLPGRCPVAREGDAYPGVTVRQLSYGKHRILYHIIEPLGQETEGSVRILHVLHGAQTSDLLSPMEENTGD